ncbi:MAG: 6,7-dimethyl-8-ribityllumazine synthase [Bacteroidales bacterium]
MTTGFRVAVVVSRYNDFVTDKLCTGALEGLAANGVAEQDVEVLHVPGAFEVPMAARRAAETGRFDAVVCLGCLIRGETAHFEYIASAASQGLMQAAGETGVPMAFGILTTDSAEQALARAESGPSNKGWEAAAAAVEMATLFRRLGDGRQGAGA